MRHAPFDGAAFIRIYCRSMSGQCSNGANSSQQQKSHDLTRTPYHFSSTGRWELEVTVCGIDYLPENEKRHVRRKKRLPQFVRMDPASWSMTYMQLLSLNEGRQLAAPLPYTGSSSSQGTVNECVASQVQSSPSQNDVVPEYYSTYMSPYACSITDEGAYDWLKFGGYKYENLVLSGGGSKGYAFIGAFKALEDCGILSSIKRIAGSSAGAICAGLFAVGCSPQEIANVFKCDIKWLFHDLRCCKIHGLCSQYGIHPARRFYEVYGFHLSLKSGNPDITFKEVLELFNKELCIVVTNLSKMCAEYCSPATTPNLPVRKAVRMSMAFPLVFHAVRCNLSGRECLYSDGGLLDQYPIRCFDGPDGCCTDSGSGSDAIYSNKTLGLYLVSERVLDYKIWKSIFGREIPYKPTYMPNTHLARQRLRKEVRARKRQDKCFSKKDYLNELKASFGDMVELWDHYEVFNKSHIDISTFGDYFVTTIETLLISQRKLHVKPADGKRTVPINCGYIGTNDYVIEPGDRAFMINQGYECTRRYLREFVARRKYH